MEYDNLSYPEMEEKKDNIQRNIFRNIKPLIFIILTTILGILYIIYRVTPSWGGELNPQTGEPYGSFTWVFIIYIISIIVIVFSEQENNSIFPSDDEFRITANKLLRYYQKNRYDLGACRLKDGRIDLKTSGVSRKYQEFGMCYFINFIIRNLRGGEDKYHIILNREKTCIGVYPGDYSDILKNERY